MDENEYAICARFKQYREKTHWSQADFAKEAGMTRNKLASIEYGRTPLYYRDAFNIISVFDLDPVWLATGQDGVHPFEKNKLPLPNAVPESSLFSEIFEVNKNGADQNIKKSANIVETFLQRAFDLIQMKHFTNEIQRQQFANEAISTIEQIASKYARRRAGSALRSKNKAK